MLLSKFRKGISKSSKYISKNIASVISRNALDVNQIQEIEDILISADLGVQVSKQLINEIKKKHLNQDVSLESIQYTLANEIEKILTPCQAKIDISKTNGPQVFLFIGVNGSGKTTTIGKLSKKLSEKNKIIVAACDTFRAAAVSQVKEWTQKSGINLYEGKENQDPASVAFEACIKAKNENFDLIFIDTAGRLGNNKNLMEQLLKIKKSSQKAITDAITKTFLVLDGSSGNNIINQFENFNDITGVDGIIITKLDGTAKGGALVYLISKYKVPIFFVGLGEKIDDLHEFKAKEFSLSLFNLFDEH